MIENQAKNSKKDKILNVIFIAISVILICFMFFTVKFWISLSVVKGDSMNPSLQSGDILITNMLTTPKEATKLKESYLKDGTKTFYNIDGTFSYEIKENEFFVLGDNRGNSEDSRYFGPINSDRIIGVVHEFWIDKKQITTQIFAFRGN